MLLEEMDARHTILGISLTVSTLFEVPFLIFASSFLRRFGNRGLLFIAIGFTALRTLLYAVVGGPFLIIAIQVIHGLTYPALTIAGVNFADDNAPTGFKSTAQGVFGAVQGGLGTAAGNLVCGLLIDQVGVRGMFSWMGGMLVVSLAVLMLVNTRLNGNNPRYT